MGVFVVSAGARCESTETCSGVRPQGCKHTQACARSSVKTLTGVRYFHSYTLRRVVSMNQAHHWEFGGWKPLVEVADQ